MIAFSSVAPSLVHVLGTNDFMGLYLSAAILSSLSSVGLSMVKARVTREVRHLYVPSLGASGAVLGCFAMIASIAPNNLFNIIFLPNVKINK